MSEFHSPTLRLDTVTGDGRAVVLVRGDVDAASAPQLTATIDAIDNQIETIEFDLSELGFLDSTGIGVIAATLRRLGPIGGTLALREVPARIMELLRITDLLGHVEILSERP